MENELYIYRPFVNAVIIYTDKWVRVKDIPQEETDKRFPELDEWVVVPKEKDESD